MLCVSCCQQEENGQRHHDIADESTDVKLGEIEIKEKGEPFLACAFNGCRPSVKAAISWISKEDVLEGSHEMVDVYLETRPRGLA
jgi:hypothetical protein